MLGIREKRVLLVIFLIADSFVVFSLGTTYKNTAYSLMNALMDPKFYQSNVIPIDSADSNVSMTVQLHLLSIVEVIVEPGWSPKVEIKQLTSLFNSHHCSVDSSSPNSLLPQPLSFGKPRQPPSSQPLSAPSNSTTSRLAADANHYPSVFHH
ncbi:hypothetical protein PoB_000213700 [Plakobranchus ocellatus]|uniref:Uncharacterized protein n=1 Tax=Plakobranchus ocellatus TaxID=259542 RepID=A0AAV3XYT0_9GAST|nr:hypothetical protein PoB_000213700 [Plakobranchus ocellatus]